MNKPKVIQWFRQDLRLSDNPALFESSKQGCVLPIYILDNVNSEEYSAGKASNVWLHESLISLDKSLEDNLSLYVGDPLKIILKLCLEYDIKKVFWNRCYEPWQIKRDAIIKQELKKNGIEAKSFNAYLLWEPWQVKKADNTPYKVFTPFFKKGCLNAEKPRKPILQHNTVIFSKDLKFSLDLSALNLLPKISWHNKLLNNWDISESGAQKAFYNFLDFGLSNYKEGRNFPSQKNVSRLSPYLHFGLISPHQIWHKLSYLEDNVNLSHFRSELGWREFSYNLLYFNQNLPKENLQLKFNQFPWQNNSQNLEAWKRGLTGIPIVDAGMRELWETGYMHNRVRMIVASFLVKNLLIDWRLGERWFWDCLFDADLANNSASWQWVAGCGADAAPYFRIFNPVTQGQKFDPQGIYIRKYVPELKKLPDQYLFSPWEAPPLILNSLGIKLGKTYPNPIVDLHKSRDNALKAYAMI